MKPDDILETRQTEGGNFALIRKDGSYWIGQQSRLYPTHFAKVSPAFGDEETAGHFLNKIAAKWEE